MTPDLPVTAVQQNLVQTRFLYWKLGCGCCFLRERGREDDTFTVYTDNKKIIGLCKFRFKVIAILF